MIILYNILFFLLSVFFFPLILPTVLFSEKRRAAFLQRLGILPIKHKQTALDSRVSSPLWIHALSVGEVLSAAPLVNAVHQRFPQIPIFFSASTRTGFQIAENRFQLMLDAVFYFPFDFMFSVKYRVREIKPCLMILIETDIWPNFLYELQARNIPVFWVNARLSQRSWRGYHKIRFFIKPLFSIFSRILVQTQADAERLISLGVSAEKLMIIGNLKFDQPVESVSVDERVQIKRKLGISDRQRILLAGSTHEGEELGLIQAFIDLKQEFSDLRLVLVPRNIERSLSLMKQFKLMNGFSVQMMTNREAVLEPAEVVIIAITGWLKQLYAISDIAFVGGSLAAFGGHNPLEPAMYSKPVIFGADMSDFAQIAKMMVDAGGAFQVRDVHELRAIVKRLLTDDEMGKQAGARAFQVFNTHKGAVDKALAEIGIFLQED